MDDLTLADIAKLQEEGRLFAELGDKRFVLMAFELYPNGTTGDVFVQNQLAAVAIGEKTGLGPPTDPAGFAIWEVPE